MLKNKKAFLFDMDGLLLDTERLHMKIWQKVLDDYYDETLVNDVLNHTIGTSGSQSEKICFELTGNKYFLQEHRNEYKVLLDNYLVDHDIDQEPGALELLSYLKQEGYTLVLVSSTFEKDVERALMKGHLEGFFDDKVCGDHVRYSKPDPEIYLKAVEDYHLNKEECLILEDSINGIIAANTAGIDVIGVPDVIPLVNRKEKHLLKIVENLYDVLEMIRAAH